MKVYTWTMDDNFIMDAISTIIFFASLVNAGYWLLAL